MRGSINAALGPRGLNVPSPGVFQIAVREVEGGRIHDVKRLTRQGSDTWRSSYLGLRAVAGEGAGDRAAQLLATKNPDQP